MLKDGRSPRGKSKRSETTSLFVVSLPRSLSTTIYTSARCALGLERPAHASAGEILNHLRTRRFVRALPPKAKFTTREHDPLSFDRHTAFLDRAAQTEGFAYKDVVNPFVVAEWPGLAQFRVLKIRRDLTEVAFAILAKGWTYPGAGAREPLDPEWSIAEGLVRAEMALAAIPGQTIEFADAILDHTALEEAIEALYPGTPRMAVNYIDDAFIRGRQRRQKIMADSRRLNELADLIDAVRLHLTATPQATRSGRHIPLGTAPSGMFQVFRRRMQAEPTADESG
jgi:hypothetical protein